MDADGELVGINTFILSTSGGNQGSGFAIPAGVVASAYPQLLKYGHVHQATIGALVQSITPELAAGLHLGRDYGVIVSDISAGGPADTAGLKIQDVILSVDGFPAGNLPLFAHSLNLHKGGDLAKIEVLRGTERVRLNVTLGEKVHKEDNTAQVADPVKNLVRPLGILGMELTLELAQSLPDLRIPTGVSLAVVRRLQALAQERVLAAELLELFVQLRSRKGPDPGFQSVAVERLIVFEFHALIVLEIREIATFPLTARRSCVIQNQRMCKMFGMIGTSPLPVQDALNAFYPLRTGHPDGWGASGFHGGRAHCCP